MSDESDDRSDSGSDDEVDPLVLGYQRMHSMFEATGFKVYKPDFQAYDAKDSNLDVAVMTWHAARANYRDDDDERSRLACWIAAEVAEAAMKAAYNSAIRTQLQNKRRRSA